MKCLFVELRRQLPCYNIAGNRNAFPAFLGFLAFWTSFAGRKKSLLGQ